MEEGEPKKEKRRSIATVVENGHFVLWLGARVVPWWPGVVKESTSGGWKGWGSLN